VNARRAFTLARARDRRRSVSRSRASFAARSRVRRAVRRRAIQTRRVQRFNTDAVHYI
jgi:hypothetical protein